MIWAITTVGVQGLVHTTGLGSDGGGGVICILGGGLFICTSRPL